MNKLDRWINETFSVQMQKGKNRRDGKNNSGRIKIRKNQKQFNCRVGGTSDKEAACQCKICKRLGFDPEVRKHLWIREWQPTPVFLTG